MMTSRKFPLIHAFVLASALSTAVMAPPAFAETVEVTILNTRGEDGIYRPALRVLRGGTVIFYNTGNAGLTEAIIRDSAALNAWLSANVPAAAGGEAVSFVVTTIESRPPAQEEEPTIKDCFDFEKNGMCSEEERADYCEAQFPGKWKRDIKGWYESPVEYCFLR